MMKDGEMNKTGISANPLNEEFKTYDAALVKNINNFLTIDQRDREYQIGDPFDPENCNLVKFRLETNPLEARDTEFEPRLPLSQDSKSLRKFNQELLELVRESGVDFSAEPFLPPFLAEEKQFLASSSECRGDIHKIPGFFRN